MMIALSYLVLRTPSRAGYRSELSGNDGDYNTNPSHHNHIADMITLVTNVGYTNPHTGKQSTPCEVAVALGTISPQHGLLVRLREPESQQTQV